MKRLIKESSAPRISIITCVYNGEPFLRRLLDSVLASKYPRIEHIVVNDGSTDSTSVILDDYKALYESTFGKDSLVVLNQDNQGLGAATDAGLKMVTGEFWTWINCDDWYSPSFFRKTVSYLLIHSRWDFVQVPAIEMHWTQGKVTNSHQGTQHINWASYQGDSLKRRLYQNKLTFFHYLVRTDCYRRINPSMSICPSRKTQDVQLAAQIFAYLDGGILRERLVYYLIRKDSLAIKNPNAGMGELDLVRQSLAFLDIPDAQKQEELLLYKAGEAVNHILACFVRRDKKGFRRFYHSFEQLASGIGKKKIKYVLPRPRGTLSMMRFFALFFAER